MDCVADMCIQVEEKSDNFLNLQPNFHWDRLEFPTFFFTFCLKKK